MIPPAGVACRDCQQKKGHFCQAQIYVDGDDAGLISPPTPLCLPCSDDQPCVVDRVGRPPRPEDVPPFEPDWEPAPVRHLSPEEVGVPRIVAREPAAAVPILFSDGKDAEHRPPRQRVPASLRVAPATRAAIEAYPDGTPFIRIAQKTGARVEHVTAIRKAIGRTGWLPGAPLPQREDAPAAEARRDELQVKVIGGEEVLMSPHATQGPEFLNPEAGIERRDNPMMDETTKAAICSDRDAGEMTVAQIAEKYGVSAATVYKASAETKRPGKKPGRRAPRPNGHAVSATAPPKGHEEPAARLTLTYDVELEEAREILHNPTPAQTVKALNAVFADYVRGLRG